jgi:osmotically-inducible protein OsmY
MKNLLWLTPVIMAATLVLPGCEKKQDERAPSSESSPSSSIGAPATAMSDSDLEKAIQSKLESDDALKQANLSVNADVKDNKATISGTVISQEMRSKAIDLAKSAQPDITIADKIE